MRKITIVLLLFLAVLLVGCGDNKDVQFKKCLSETKPLSSKTIDDMFLESGKVIPEDIFSKVMIDNTKILTETNGIKGDIHVWQEESIIYINTPAINENHERSTKTSYLDLNELEVIYDTLVAQSGVTSNIKPSEMYEKIITDYGYELGLKDTIFTERSLDELLDSFNFKYEDFEKVEDGKYSVKKEVIYKKILTWSLQELSVEQFIELLKQSNLEMNLYVYFDGKHINAYEAVIRTTLEEEIQEISVKLSFLYNEDTFIGVKTELFAGDIRVCLVVENIDGAFIVDLLINLSKTEEIALYLKVSNDNFKFSLKNNNLELYNVNLNYGVNQANGKFFITGDLSLNNINKVTITSGVVIPNEILATKDKAYNMLEEEYVGLEDLQHYFTFVD